MDKHVSKTAEVFQKPLAGYVLNPNLSIEGELWRTLYADKDALDASISTRIETLKKVAQFTPDYSLTSLFDLTHWFRNHITIHHKSPLTQEANIQAAQAGVKGTSVHSDAVRNTIAALETDHFLSEETASLAVDVVLYAGEVLKKLQPSLEWQQLPDNQNSDFVLTSGSTRPPFLLIQSAALMAREFAASRGDETYLFQCYVDELRHIIREAREEYGRDIKNQDMYSLSELYADSHIPWKVSGDRLNKAAAEPLVADFVADLPNKLARLEKSVQGLSLDGTPHSLILLSRWLNDKIQVQEAKPYEDVVYRIAEESEELVYLVGVYFAEVCRTNLPAGKPQWSLDNRATYSTANEMVVVSKFDGLTCRVYSSWVRDSLATAIGHKRYSKTVLFDLYNKVVENQRQTHDFARIHPSTNKDSK